MLELLHIENIAVIEQAEVSFRPGLNALTGETGAGKSIVIDALGAVLGGRASRDLVRTGAAGAFVSALFSGVPADLPGLADAGAAVDGEGCLLLQREIGSDGKTVCRINGRPVTVTQLKQAGCQLLNIHGQHDGQQLLDPALHGAYLDRFGQLQAALDDHRRAYRHQARLQTALADLMMDEAEKERRTDTLRFQIGELESAGLTPGEEEALSARRRLLRHGERYLSALSGAQSCLSGEEDAPGAVSALGMAAAALRDLRDLDGETAEIYDRLCSLRCEAEDLAETIRDRQRDFDFSPAELDALEARLDLLHRLKRKYGSTAEEMLAFLDACRRELASIETAEEQRAQLERQLTQARAAAEAAGAVLTQQRRRAAETLEACIRRELAELDMGRVQFCVDLAPCAMGPEGCERVSFLLSANAGEALRPLSKIASGGELSRIMLALKNVLSAQEAVATLVFDEVDAGVSGRAAQRVAEKLAQVARHKQVLCVTHLPQIAAMADTHFSVEKGEAGGRTFTRISLLDRRQRQAELGRLTGGSSVTEAMLQSAGELLDQAEGYRRALSAAPARERK